MTLLRSAPPWTDVLVTWESLYFCSSFAWRMRCNVISLGLTFYLMARLEIISATFIWSETAQKVVLLLIWRRASLNEKLTCEDWCFRIGLASATARLHMQARIISKDLLIVSAIHIIFAAQLVNPFLSTLISARPSCLLKWWFHFISNKF